MRVVKILLLVLVVAALAPYVVAPFYRTGHPVSTLMAWRSLRVAPMQREWIDLAAMSPSLPRSVVAAEDAHFCKHHGIDWGALREAIDDAKEDGTPFRGASTITQQVAKNLFLWQGRDFVRKAGIPVGALDRSCPAQGTDPGDLPQHRRARSAGPVWGGDGQRLCLRQIGRQPLPPGGGASGLDPAESGQTQRQEPWAGCPAVGRDLCGKGAGLDACDLLAGKSLISGLFRAHFPAQEPSFAASLPL